MGEQHGPGSPDFVPSTRAEMRAHRDALRREASITHRVLRRLRPSGSKPQSEPEQDVPVTRASLREARRRARQEIGPVYVVREIGIVVVLALVLSFVIKTWLVQPFFIPSGSMEDTLAVGDRVLVSKLSPTPQQIQRGDIVVFEDPGDWLNSPTEVRRSVGGNVVHDVLVFLGLAPDDADNHLIKRVIGLPGDRVKCCTADLELTVNGQAIDETYVKAGDDPSIDPFDITVPEGKLWVMGDHRSNSGDSRYHPLGGDGSQGSVPISKVVGRAVVIVWPADRMSWLGRPTSMFAKVPDPTG